MSVLVKVNESVLKIGEIQEEVLGNSSGDVGENNDKISNRCINTNDNN